MIRNNINWSIEDNKVKQTYTSTGDETCSIKKETEDKTFHILKDPAEDDEIEDEIDLKEEDEFFRNFMKMAYLSQIDSLVKKIEPILQSPFTQTQKNFMMKMISQIWDEKNILIFIEFFSKRNNNIKFSFEEMKKLILLNLDEKKLENFVRIHDELFYWSNVFIKNIDNPEILSDDIVNKAITLHKIALNYEGEMALNIDLDVKNFLSLKDINLSEELIKKIEKLLDNGVSLSIKDLELIDNIEINSELENKLEKLWDKVNIDWNSLSIIQSINMDKDFLTKIESLYNVWITLNWYDLLKVKNITLTQDNINKLKYVIKQPECNPYYIDCLNFILALEYEEIDKIVSDAEELWFSPISFWELEGLYKIPQEALQYCKDNWINNINDVKKVKELYLVSDKEHLREYLKRKSEYLEKNMTLPDEKYESYFWSKWKFGKHEIYQWNIWLCYLYSWLEIFKKMNWFDVIIQSNFIEKEDGWLVRLPFNTWPWIKVNKLEIDKTYETINNQWNIRKMDINSKSEYLWFKILEIAYIKSKLIKNKLWEKKWEWQEYNPLDIKLNGDALKRVEGWDTIEALQDLFSSECIIKWNIIWFNRGYNRLQHLVSMRSPKCILDEQKRIVKNGEDRINKLFDLFGLWIISIEVWINSDSISSWEWIEKMQSMDKVLVLVDNVKIINKSWQEISKDKIDNFKDIIQSDTWKTKVLLIPNHAYSVEKCYIDENWIKRLRIVNPWHTDIKFDLSLDQCKNLFDWNFWVVNIDKLFR